MVHASLTIFCCIDFTSFLPLMCFGRVRPMLVLQRYAVLVLRRLLLPFVLAVCNLFWAPDVTTVNLAPCRPLMHWIDDITLHAVRTSPQTSCISSKFAVDLRVVCVAGCLCRSVTFVPQAGIDSLVQAMRLDYHAAHLSRVLHPVKNATVFQRCFVGFESVAGVCSSELVVLAVPDDVFLSWMRGHSDMFGTEVRLLALVCGDDWNV